MRNALCLILVAVLGVPKAVVAQADPKAEIAAMRGEIGRLVERLDRSKPPLPSWSTRRGSSWGQSLISAGLAGRSRYPS